jgi:ribosome assembly protein YihI (activator of Der GTPase)
MMESPEKRPGRPKKKSMDEIRREMQADLVPLIAEEALRILRDRIESGEKITDGEIGDAIRQIVDNRIDTDNKLFSKLVFPSRGDIYDEVVPLVQRGMEKMRERISGEKTAA